MYDNVICLQWRTVALNTHPLLNLGTSRYGLVFVSSAGYFEAVFRIRRRYHLKNGNNQRVDGR